MVAQFRKRPVVIEAMRFDGSGLALSALEVWSAGAVGYSDADGVFVATLEGVMYVNDGDWVIRGVKGEFYPCKPDIFDATYEPVEIDLKAGEPTKGASS